jgi:threonine synthase
MRPFLPEFPAEVLTQVAARYGVERFDPQPAPLVQVGDYGVLELWHGPTAAFKDLALQVFPLLLAAGARQTGIGKVLILTATSGDTGKAALEAFRDVPGVSIAVFYPEGGVSAVQEAQMLTTGGGNTAVAAVRGNFDTCQSAVKAAFVSAELRATLAERGISFSSANSINWGRLLPQIAYYVWAYLEAVRQGKVKSGAPMNVCVPTGNFGNILAAYYAKDMGLPLGRLICASNSNKVLADFFTTAVYDKNREFRLTSSPSMDILISSNLERLLYALGGCDAEVVKELYGELASGGHFTVPPEVFAAAQGVFHGDWADEQVVQDVIGKVWREHAYLLDPHTAVAWAVADAYRSQSTDAHYTLVVSTASPFKFAPAVLAGLGENAGDDPWRALAHLSEVTGWEVPPSLAGLRLKASMSATTLAPAAIPDFVRGLCG